VTCITAIHGRFITFYLGMINVIVPKFTEVVLSHTSGLFV
jgi:hypothetical protein